MSLVELAESGQLPKFQLIDGQTLEWICDHKPSLAKWEYPKSYIECSLRLRDIDIEPSWFLESKIINGIHGIRHAVRVCMYAGVLSTLLKLSEEEWSLIKIAALLHDVRRIDDKRDSEHGVRCANWLKKNFHEMVILQPFRKEQLQSIATAIGLHEIPYVEMDTHEEYRVNNLIVDVLKTADALDRYRLPRLNWWIDDSHLKIKPTDDLKAFSFDLVTVSERGFLQGKENMTSILDALGEIYKKYE